MALFKTHLTVAAAVTGALSVTTLYADLATPATALVLWIVGTLGGLLPDIDAKSSITLRLFTLLFLAVLATFVVIRLNHSMTLMWTLLAVAGALATASFIVIPLLTRMMVHRGNCHSLLAALLSAFTTAFVSIHVADTSIQTGYLVGISTGVGFITHLLLDEIYSVNIKDIEIKRSFGSAMKLFSRRSPISSFVMAGLCAVGFWWMPEPDSLQTVLQRLAQASMHALG